MAELFGDEVARFYRELKETQGDASFDSFAMAHLDSLEKKLSVGFYLPLFEEEEPEKIITYDSEGQKISCYNLRGRMLEIAVIEEYEEAPLFYHKKVKKIPVLSGHAYLGRKDEEEILYIVLDRESSRIVRTSDEYRRSIEKTLGEYSIKELFMTEKVGFKRFHKEKESSSLG